MLGALFERQLAGVLRQFHLTGMLDTLEGRLAEARASRLGHVEFLHVLLEGDLFFRSPYCGITGLVGMRLNDRVDWLSITNCLPTKKAGEQWLGRSLTWQGHSDLANLARYVYCRHAPTRYANNLVAPIWRLRRI